VRHIDPQATMGYLEAEALVTAIGEGALPFHNTTSEEREADTEERTSFSLLLAEYKLDQANTALVLFGDIIAGAETTEAGLVHESAGVRAIAQGMNALAQSDEGMVELMLPVFDALYAYCVRQMQGLHGWANEAAPVEQLAPAPL
jgi:hypothetical protein